MVHKFNYLAVGRVGFGMGWWKHM